MPTTARSLPAAERHRQSSLFGTVVIALRTLSLAVILALAVRTFLYEPFSIPSESMQPALLPGDYILVAKYPYGYSAVSFPWVGATGGERVGAKLPRRGDVIVFRTPQDGEIYIKRVIGLPGETVGVANGRPTLGDEAAAPRRIADYFIESTSDCRPARRVGDGCVFRRYREELPDGISVDTLDTETTSPLDASMMVEIPAGHVFVMGDNRDDSQDSRVDAASGGFGTVPVEAIIGRASIIFFSHRADEGEIRWNRFGRRI
ncbi:MAG: signal peptidase I [Pacificimonas sp.]